MDYGKISKETMGHLYAAHKSLGDSPLAADLRALIELRVSQINGCDYCCKLHTGETLKLGIDPSKVESLPGFMASGAFSDAEKEALLWAESLTKLGGHPRIESTNLAKYFSERERVDLTIAVSLMNAFNRLAMSLKEA